jgi:hypothetical protein
LFLQVRGFWDLTCNSWAVFEGIIIIVLKMKGIKAIGQRA